MRGFLIPVLSIKVMADKTNPPTDYGQSKSISRFKQKSAFVIVQD